MSRLKFRSALLATVAGAWSLAAAAQAGVITGAVIEKSTGKPLAGATVSIPGTSYSAVTGPDGRFTLNDVPAGDYSLEMNREGYRAAAINLKASQTGTTDATFSAFAASLNEVVVVGNRYQATRLQMAAANTITVMSANDLQHTASHNVAEALALMPSVNVMTTGSGFIGGVDAASRGEGMYVSVRGMDDEYNVETINGVDLVRATPYSRAVQLSLMPPSGLQTIVLNDTSRADMDGEAIGGTIDFRTPTAYDYNGRTSGSIQIGGNLETRASSYGQDGVGESVAIDGQHKFGANDQFGVYASAYYDIHHYANSVMGGVAETGCCDRAWAFAVESANTTSPVSAPGMSPGNNLISTGFNVGESSGKEERWGGTLSLDWRANDTTTAYFRMTYGQALVQQNSALTQYVGMGVQNGSNGLAIGNTGLYQPVISYVQPRFWYETNPEHETMGTAQIGGESVINHWTIAPNLFFAWGADDRPNHIEVAARVNDINGGNGLTYGGTSLFTASNGYPVPIMTPTAYNYLNNVGSQPAAGGSPEYTPQTSGQQLGGAKIDIKYDFDGGLLKYVKFGVKHETSWREVTNRDYTVPNYGGAATFGDLGIISSYSAHVWEGRYNWSVPNINQSKLWGLFNALGGATDATSDECGSDPINNYNCNTQKAREATTSAYAMVDFKYKDLEITPGFRFEHTDILSTYWNHQSTTVTDLNGVSTTTVVQNFATAPTHYDVPLPSIFFTYRPSADAVYRASVWTSYERPPFYQLAPGATTNTSGGTTSISQGNPDLKVVYATNFDLSGEWQNHHGGHLMLATYYKLLRDYLYDSGGNVVNATQVQGVNVGTVITKPFNGSNGTVFGVTLAARQKFQDMPAPFDGFGVDGNVTRTWTSVDLGPPGLTGQRIQNVPDVMANVRFFYEKNNISVDLTYHYTGEYVTTYDTLGFGQGWDNVWQRPNTKLDLHAGYRYHDWKLDFSMTNLTDTWGYWTHVGKDNLNVSDIANTGQTALVTVTRKF